MASACGGSLLTYLSQVPDPRGRNGRRHSLSAMLTAVVCEILCGNRSYSALVEWPHDLPVDVWHWMGCTRRPSKLDCFRDLLMRLDPEALEESPRKWTTEDLKLSACEDELSATSLDANLPASGVVGQGGSGSEGIDRDAGAARRHRKRWSIARPGD